MLPCCAFLNSGTITSSNDKVDKNIKIPDLSWRDPENIPSSDPSAVTHIPLLEKYGIPYIIDIHSHFFPENVMKLIWKWFDKVDWKISYRQPIEERLQFLSMNKIRYYTTLNYAHKSGMAENLNEWIFHNYKNWEGAIPFGTFYPEEDVNSYIRKAVEDYQFTGFKLHCEVSKLNLNHFLLRDTFQYLEKKQIPIVIHSGTAPLPGEFTGIKYFSDFMKNFPELLVIVAHMGAYEVNEYASLLKQYPNLKLDTTMVFVDYKATGQDPYEYFEILDGFPDRILFGSDFPNIPYNLSHAVEGILNSDLTLETKHKVLYKNSKNLLKI